MSKTISAEKNLDELILDKANPRFAELYSGSGKEEDLIEYLLYTESGKDIVAGILKAEEFYPDRPLWVLQHGSKYLVKDGNRRCAAVKALQFPLRYGLDLPKFNLTKLPVLIYKNKKDLNQRITQEHAASLFKEWDRIAKALEVYKSFTSGSSIESMKDIDSNPADLIKLASFYYEAVKIKKDDLKKLLRRGRGETGGKTIIFERLFKYRKLCGYNFKNGPSYKIDIFNPKKFSGYVSALVDYLKEHPETKHQVIDDEKENFFSKLKQFGFEPIEKKIAEAIDSKIEFTKQDISLVENRKRKSIKNRPNYERKQVPAPLDKLIKECYDLDCNNFSNAKTALTRVSFECALKYVIENTEYKLGKKMSKSQFFKDAYFNKKGNKRNRTDFDTLKNKFTELILNTGKRNAFSSFDLHVPHQIIHNYDVGAIPANATALCDNLIVLLEFMLQEKTDLLSSIDLKKL